MFFTVLVDLERCFGQMPCYLSPLVVLQTKKSFPTLALPSKYLEGLVTKSCRNVISCRNLEGFRAQKLANQSITSPLLLTLISIMDPTSPEIIPAYVVEDTN